MVRFSIIKWSIFHLTNTVILIQDGFLKSNYPIHKFKYYLIHDILDIIDGEDEYYANINLNQIYKIEINRNNIVLYLKR